MIRPRSERLSGRDAPPAISGVSGCSSGGWVRGPGAVEPAAISGLLWTGHNFRGSACHTAGDRRASDPHAVMQAAWHPSIQRVAPEPRFNASAEGAREPCISMSMSCRRRGMAHESCNPTARPAAGQVAGLWNARPPRTFQLRESMADRDKASRPPLVLIANDQEWSARSLESILGPNGYAVVRAYTGQQALE